jgi:predicted nucleotidyltransferase
MPRQAAPFVPTALNCAAPKSNPGGIPSWARRCDEFNTLGAQKVVVFGSWAARYHGQAGALPADIDVLVVGDGIDRADLYAAAERAEARLGMPVNPVMRPSRAWDEPEGDALLVEIQSGPYVDVTETVRPA